MLWYLLVGDYYAVRLIDKIDKKYFYGEMIVVFIMIDDSFGIIFFIMFFIPNVRKQTLPLKIIYSIFFQILK